MRRPFPRARAASTEVPEMTEMTWLETFRLLGLDLLLLLLIGLAAGDCFEHVAERLGSRDAKPRS
jgi:hypothetical protein